MQSYTFISMLYNTSVVNMLYDCNLKQLDHSVVMIFELEIRLKIHILFMH